MSVTDLTLTLLWMSFVALTLIYLFTDECHESDTYSFVDEFHSSLTLIYLFCGCVTDLPLTLLWMSFMDRMV